MLKNKSLEYFSQIRQPQWLSQHKQGVPLIKSVLNMTWQRQASNVCILKIEISYAYLREKSISDAKGVLNWVVGIVNLYRLWYVILILRRTVNEVSNALRALSPDSHCIRQTQINAWHTAGPVKTRQCRLKILQLRECFNFDPEFVQKMRGEGKESLRMLDLG